MLQEHKGTSLGYFEVFLNFIENFPALSFSISVYLSLF